jgi:hypothetical protein
MATDPNPNCPYYDRIPVPPIVDLQIDLVVINEILKPELKTILKMLKTMLESSDAWSNWFEIYLAYFILLNNVELTMAHDAWFVKRNNLKVRTAIISTPISIPINRFSLFRKSTQTSLLLIQSHKARIPS